jgi:hypothetical protein
MSLLPISRESMLSLKALKDEEIRQKAEADRKRRISQIVSNIYTSAKTLAETTTQTSYSYKICLNSTAMIIRRGGYRESAHDDYEFLMRNMDEILRHLKDLFPGCVVEHRGQTFARGQDGKEYDVATLDASLLPFLKIHRGALEIVVDWS